jgi:hypothetical protein
MTLNIKTHTTIQVSRVNAEKIKTLAGNGKLTIKDWVDQHFNLYFNRDKI